jgi:hypothetical protein
MSNDSNVVNIEDYLEKHNPEEFDITFRASKPGHTLVCEYYINDLGKLSVRVTEVAS